MPSRYDQPSEPDIDQWEPKPDEYQSLTFRDSILPLAKDLVAELDNPRWEGCTVRELVLRMQEAIERADTEE
jgi:hypothetical protein